MVDLKTIRLTWMDGQEQIFEEVTTSVHDGVLHVHQYVGSAHLLKDEWHIPTSNVRLWKPVLLTKA